MGNDQYYRILQDIKELDSLREQLQSSVYCQSYHIQPYAGLLNDPNGFIYDQGIWHLFYQWCPWGAFHGQKHWYHLCSKDLVHWEELGPAIIPDREYENEGAFSGTAIYDREAGNGIRLFYAGNQRNQDGKLVPNVCTAKLYDDGHIEKSECVLIPPHPDYTHDQRDPQIICEQDTYYILMGARSKDERGCLLLYRSDQMLSGWEFAGEVRVPGYDSFGTVWECPSIMHLGDLDLLIFCPQNIMLSGRGQAPHHNVYLLGHMDYQSAIFEPKGSYQFLDSGFDFYAAQCAAGTPAGNALILSAWMGLPAASYPTDSENWSGCLTLPRELTIERGELIQRPIDALKNLRGQHWMWDKESVMIMPRSCEWLLRAEYTDQELKDPGRNLCEKIEIIRIFARKDHTGGVILSYDAGQQMLWIDRSHMTHRFQIEQGEVRGIALRRPLESLHGYVDQSSLEIFVNDGEAVITTRVFPVVEECYIEIADHDKMTSMELWEI